MTTTFDTDLSSDTIAAEARSEPTESLHAYYDDPDAYTISEAWASSLLGEPDDEISYDSAATEVIDEPKPPTSRAALAAALAAGIIGGATLGAVLFGYADPAQPTFVVPWGAVKTSPSQAEVAPSSGPQGQPKPATTAAAPKPAGQAPAPKPIVAEQRTNQDVIGAPVGPATPPAPPVMVDIFIPPLPPLGDNPEPPAPEPPPFDPPDIDVLQVPELEPDQPKPEPPNNEVLQVPTLDPDLLQPTVTGLQPIQGGGDRATLNSPQQPQTRISNTPDRATVYQP